MRKVTCLVPAATAEWNRIRVGLLAVAVVALGVSHVHAQSLAIPATPAYTNIYTADASGNWSTNANWSTGTAPASSASDILGFLASGSTYTATDDISGTFTFGSLVFNGDSSSAITLAGNTLSTGAGPAGIVQNGAAPVTIGNTITGTGTSSGSPLTVSGFGTGSVTFSGPLTQTEGLGVNALTPITVDVANANNTFGLASNVTYGRQMASPGSVLEFTGSAASGNTPTGGTTGTGGYWMNAAGTMDFAPSGSNGAVTETLGTSYYYDSLGGGILELNKGSNTSLNLTLDAFLYYITGSAGADSTLVVEPASGVASFGTSSGEEITQTAGFSDKNGLVVVTSVVTNSATDSTGSFMTGTTVPKQFTAYTNTYSTPGGGFDTSSAGTQVDAVTANTVTAGSGAGNGTLTSMVISNSSLTISSGDTVTMKGGAFNSGHAAQSGIILNNTSSPASIAGPGTLAFGLNEGDFYVSAGTASISANITSTLLPTTPTSPGPALVKFGPGTLVLTGTNSFASGAFITTYGGLISFAAPGSGDPAALGTGTIDLLMGGGGGYQLTGGSYAPSAHVIFGMVSDGSTASYPDTGGGTIDVEGAGNTLTIAQSGQFFDQSTGNPLFKTGAGTLAFGAAYNLLSPTVINGGVVAINAAMTSTGTGQFVVNNTGKLVGTGTIYGRVTLAPLGAIEPGPVSGSIGKLILSGASAGAVFYPTGIYDFAYNPDASGATPGTDNDEIASTAATLDLSNLSATNQFDINMLPLDADTPNGSVYTAGVFSSIILPSGVTAANIGSLFDFTGTYSGTPTVSEGGTTQLLISFSATPEPASLSLLGLGAIGLLARRRK